jgi:hypothetical protein
METRAPRRKIIKEGIRAHRVFGFMLIIGLKSEPSLLSILS